MAFSFILVHSEEYTISNLDKVDESGEEADDAPSGCCRSPMALTEGEELLPSLLLVDGPP